MNFKLDSRHVENHSALIRRAGPIAGGLRRSSYPLIHLQKNLLQRNPPPKNPWMKRWTRSRWMKSPWTR